MDLRIKLLTPSAIAPCYATSGAAGLDLHADLGGEGKAAWILGESTKITMKVPTGIAVQLPPGHVGLIRGRSGLASRGLLVAEGTLDEDYTGELMVMLCVYRGTHSIHHGDRIGQLVLLPCPRFNIFGVGQLGETVRGTGGFGSTGK